MARIVDKVSPGEKGSRPHTRREGEDDGYVKEGIEKRKGILFIHRDCAHSEFFSLAAGAHRG
jgi:hypothetical protein